MSNTEVIPLIHKPPKPSPIGLAITKLVFCAIPIAKITIGAVYLDDCPRQPYIPIYLIVGGTFTMMLSLLSCLPCAKKPEDGTTNPLYTVSSVWYLLVFLFLFSWSITGRVWIYSIYEPNYDKTTTDEDPYCNKTLYLFAFWITTVGSILLGSCLFLCCCCFLQFYCSKARVPPENV